MVALSVRSPKEFAGRLEEVNDLGVILILAPGSEHEVEAFYPWVAIRRVRLQGAMETEPRSGLGPGITFQETPAGFPERGPVEAGLRKAER